MNGVINWVMPRATYPPLYNASRSKEMRPCEIGYYADLAEIMDYAKLFFQKAYFLMA